MPLNTAAQMPSLDQRYSQSLAALNNLPAGAAAWLWIAAPCSGAPPFFVIVPQDTDPSGRKLARRAQWVAEQSAPTATARGLVRRLQSGLLTLSTDAPIDPIRVLYAGLCGRASMPDLLVMQLREGRVVDAQWLQDLRPLAEDLGKMAPGETRWFTLSDGASPARLRVAADRAALDSRAAVRGQLRATDGGDFLIRVDSQQSRALVSALQQWGRQAAPWPVLQALTCARIVSKSSSRKQA